MQTRLMGFLVALQIIAPNYVEAAASCTGSAAAALLRSFENAPGADDSPFSATLIDIRCGDRNRDAYCSSETLGNPGVRIATRGQWAERFSQLVTACEPAVEGDVSNLNVARIDCKRGRQETFCRVDIGAQIPVQEPVRPVSRPAPVRSEPVYQAPVNPAPPREYPRPNADGPRPYQPAARPVAPVTRPAPPAVRPAKPDSRAVGIPSAPIPYYGSRNPAPSRVEPSQRESDGDQNVLAGGLSQQVQRIMTSKRTSRGMQSIGCESNGRCKFTRADGCEPTTDYAVTGADAQTLVRALSAGGVRPASNGYYYAAFECDGRGSCAVVPAVVSRNTCPNGG